MRHHATFTLGSLALFAVAISSISAGNYGIVLFMILPVLVGALGVFVSTPQTMGQAIGKSSLAILVASALLLLVKIEGAICILMTLPLALPLAWFGAWIAFRLLGRRALHENQTAALFLVLALAPVGAGTEHLWKPADPVFPVSTSVDIAAPPSTVWQHVVSFSNLPAERDWVFHLGLAYPLRATIDGTGVGAVRRCEFSTGPFIEPITVWDAPRHLAFRVTSNPAPMEEWTPHGHLDAPHLHGYLVSHRGEFRLKPLDGGRRTRLTGTTWYQHHLQPAAYWRVWSDWIIHRIHLRVLTHVRTLAEPAKR